MPLLAVLATALPTCILDVQNQAAVRNFVLNSFDLKLEQNTRETRLTEFVQVIRLSKFKINCVPSLMCIVGTCQVHGGTWLVTDDQNCKPVVLQKYDGRCI